MSSLKNTIRSNVVNRSDKYNISQQKIAKVIEISNSNCYTVSVINRDGANTVEYNVAIRKDNNDKGLISWEPAVGDLVNIAEDGRRFVITGRYDSSINNSTNYDYYSNSINSTLGGFLQ
jgi:hypothetical protein